MATPTEEARRKVIDARGALGDEFDELSASVRTAVDIPAKVRRNPVQTAALAGGAGFLLVGGPRRVLRAVAGRVRPRNRRPHEGLLPDEIERLVKKRSGHEAPEIAGALENDFADYLKRKGKAEPPPTAEQSFWRTYDSFIGPLASIAARELAQRLFQPEKARTPTRSGDDRQDGGTKVP